jgi:lipoprotein-releasing system ATP-binding protein
MTATFLAVRDIVKEYPSPAGPLRILNGVSFELTQGASLSIMGPSGSGKSTLLNILGTLDAPTSGCVLWGSENIHGYGPARAAEFRNRKVGFVFQDHHLFPQCTALENILIPCLVSGKPEAGAGERARQLLKATGLGAKADYFPAELSGGEKQRVAVARAMINSPALLLCDEPTGNLDADTSETIANLCLELRDRENVALIVVTHNAAIARMFGQVKVLKEGRLCE